MDTTKIKTLRKLLPLIPGMLLALVLLSLSWSNKSIVLGLAKEAVTWLSPSLLTENLESRLSDGLEEKYDYIELNGWMNKVLGINTLNERQKLANGSLASFADYTPEERILNQIPKLADFLEESGIDFFCASMATKEYSHDAVFAPGYDSSGPEIYNAFTGALEASGIPYMDLDDWYRERGWGLEETYFRTDHHWVPEAAFAATGGIMEELSRRYDIRYDPGTLDLTNWNVEVYEDWMLGSEGKRTGESYAGLDDLTYLYPKDAGDITVHRINAEGMLDTDLEHTLYDTKYLTAPSGYEWNSYCLYLGGDYPMVHIRNPQAVNDQKLLVMGDSYRLPVECFLSTQFTEIYHLDNRYYTDGTQAEYIRQIDPDVVLLLFCIPGNGMTHEFGLGAWEHHFAGKAPGEVLASVPEITMDPAQSGGDFYLLEGNLSAGAYEVTLDQASLVAGEGNPDSHIQFGLVELETGKLFASRYFLTDWEEPQKWLFTIPEGERGNFAAVIYNGTRHQSLGSSARLEGVTLRRYA